MKPTPKTLQAFLPEGTPDAFRLPNSPRASFWRFRYHAPTSSPSTSDLSQTTWAPTFSLALKTKAASR